MTRKKNGGRRGTAALRAAPMTDRPNRRDNGLVAIDRPVAMGHAEGGGFTMRDEARNTSHSHVWDRDTRLRHRVVSFVSGGLVEPLQEAPKNAGSDDDAGGGAANGKADRPSCSTQQQTGGTSSDATERLCENIVLPGGFGPSRDPDDPLEPAVLPRRRSEADCSDSGEEEVILFKGRGNIGVATPGSMMSLRSMRDEIATIEWSTEASRRQGTAAMPMHCGVGDSSASEAHEDDIDAVLADYIANMSGEDLGQVTRQSTLNRRDLGGTDYDVMHGYYPHDKLIKDDTAGPACVDDHVEESIEGSGLAEGGSRGLPHDPGREQSALHLATLDELGSWVNQDICLNEGDVEGVDGASYAPRTRNCDNLASRSGTIPPGRVPQGRRANSVATAAETADDLDFLDRHQLQLRVDKTGKGAPPFELSDSELEARLNRAWQLDRIKKKGKKEARELLRSEGLLRREVNPEHPLVKYRQGISLEDIHNELRSFLAGIDESLALPPMDSPTRKIIHELANRLKLKSKSTGSGNQRRPVLYRTKQTGKQGEAYLDESVARVRRRYFGGKAAGADRQVGSSRLKHGAVTVRDGEVVGGSAPELGLSNKGRAMLEKMGWSSGTALGAADNKGIMQPIEHIVKRSKAGLG